MRSITTCYSEHAIRVSDSYCSGPSLQSYRSPSQSRPSSPGPAEITNTYRARLCSGKQLLISLTWRNSFLRQGLIIDFSDQASRESPARGSPKQLRKTKGSKSFQCSGLVIDVSWDLTFARFQGAPEPVSGFYVIVQADSKVVLRLGDAYDDDEDDEEKLLDEKRPKTGNLEFALISRSEQFMGGSTYSTRAKFGRNGAARDHEVHIKCGQDEEEVDGAPATPVLSVFVDGKRMFRVQRLRWNFRGNQTIFVDGLLVDMMWDVHDWLFGPRFGYAVFMLRTRSGLDSRLWLEEKNLQGNELEKVEFSLLICACNSSPSPN
ncbi:uncharacterized protein LOC116206676 [Punica granatum]|uniref:DUF868 domain-containing protein n=2 Tax=Punica granatum TaxID=22663 RepID=A0A218XDU5_PUNGR|nr:uncharacterized protein LOC116206676 [Punica granatum]OWM82502.1 hypothetical protein CDL15_Pgr002077 [Punica granatum]PKI35995.1 hypothetical protein CRG98_043624 [Punica granatum]